MQFLLNTRTRWSEPPRARHQLADALSKTHKVTFIEANKTGFPRVGLSQVKERLMLATPSFWLDYRIRFRLPLFNELYQCWLNRRIGTKYEQGSTVLITFDHTSDIFCRKWKGQVVYFCNDDHLRSYGIPLLKHYFRYKEKKLADTAGIIIVTSDYLLKRFSNFNKPLYLIKLGAPEIPDSPEIHYHFSEKVKIAWVGFGSKKNDLSTFTEILKEGNNMELHIVGKLDEKILRHFSPDSNFHYHGVKKGEELYTLLNQCNVAIAPYSLNDVNKGGTPNKLWLYLATGLPVVVTNIDNIKNWEFPERFVYRSEDNSDFLEKINLAYRENNEALYFQRKAYAKKNTWQARAEELIKIIKQHEPTHPTT